MTVLTINKHSCPTCGQSVNPREIVLTRCLVDALRDVFAWCEREGRWLKVRRKEFKHCFTDETTSANFAYWKAFAPDLVGAKENKGYYDFDRQGIAQFLQGQSKVATRILRDPLTKIDTLEDYRAANEIPGIGTQLTENDEFVVKYQDSAELTQDNVPVTAA